jgi:hypothetical protein
VLLPERAEHYTHCTRRECREQHARPLTITAVAMNKAAWTKAQQELGLISSARGMRPDEIAERPAGNSRVQQGGRGEDQDGAGLGFADGSWRQQQAEVAVADPARLQDLPERIRAKLVHRPTPAFLHGCSGNQATRSTR